MVEDGDWAARRDLTGQPDALCFAGLRHPDAGFPEPHAEFAAEGAEDVPRRHVELRGVSILVQRGDPQASLASLIHMLGAGHDRPRRPQAHWAVAPVQVDPRASIELPHAEVAVRGRGEAAQRSFEFNEAISARALKQALMSEFIRVCNDEGVDATDVVPLRRALDLFALSRPNALPDALKQAISPVVELADEIPPLVISGGVEARRSRLGAYEVFPTNMNENERRFAELLDSDESGQVKWWLRLQENSNWAVTLMLPSGKRFFPDFAVGVVGRRSQDAIALIETKDDGVTGRLHSDANREKIVASHQEYRNVRWTYQGERGWTELHYNGALDQIQPLRPFSIDHLAKLA